VSSLRDLKELRWRRRGPPLPNTVLDAVTLKISSPLPDAYRAFLSQMDGGRPGHGYFRVDGREYQIEGFYPVAEATDQGAKMTKSGKIPEGIIPIAFVADEKHPERKGPPLVFMEVASPGRILIRTSPRAKFHDEKAVFPIAGDFAQFLDLLGEQASCGAVSGPANGGEVKEEAAKKAPPAQKKTASPSVAAPKKKTATKKKAAKKKATKKKAAKKKATKKKAAKKKATKKKATKKKAAKKTATKKKAAKKKATKKKAAKKKATKKKAAKKTATKKKAAKKKAAKKTKKKARR